MSERDREREETPRQSETNEQASNKRRRTEMKGVRASFRPLEGGAGEGAGSIH